MEAEAAFDGQPHYSARAACGGGISTTQYRDSASPSVSPSNSFPNIQGGVIPWAADGGYYGASYAIGLAYQAYFSYAPLRNTINLLTDFSVSKVHVNTTNLRVKRFFETWFDAINLNQFMAQFFLEYYRSGNVFIYKFNGEISEDGMNMLRESYARAGETIAAKKSPLVPIRYTILNPMQVYLQQGPYNNNGYVRMLSTFELQRLRNPQTEEDVQVLLSFPPDIQAQIKRGGTYNYIYVPLDTKRLYYVFYRKMDYEPLAVPMAWPVLNDIEFKLELRRMDMALAATIERVILLITTGRPADQWNQVPPKSTILGLQEMFSNQSIGRVLVADYTTKAQWVVPDLKELIGPGKYEQVDKDIRDGLGYAFIGEEKFANASIKVKIFIEGLKEGRRAFMETFLIPEVKKICEEMGFRNVPDLEFEQIQIQDEALMNRLYVQMAQLGLLTAEEVNEALRTGMLPTAEESLVDQEAYKKARSKGLYEPMAPKTAGGDGRPSGTGGTPAARKVATPIGQSKASLQTETQAGDLFRHPTYRFGISRIEENLTSMNALRASVESALSKQWKVKELGEEERGIATSIAMAIAFNEDPKNGGWKKAVSAYTKPGGGGLKPLSQEVAAALVDLRTTFDCPEAPVDSWRAAVLLRSKVDITPES